MVAAVGLGRGSGFFLFFFFNGVRGIVPPEGG